MAERSDLDFIYSQIDRIFRMSIGETGDFSCARYNGNYSLSLEEAQLNKHRTIARELGIVRGSRVIDLGCGWGPFLAFLRETGAEGVGVTLSSGQAAACARQGLDARVVDCRTVMVDDVGKFDAAVSLGAFEHFCSMADWRAGRQEEIYRDFFANTAGLLRPGKRLYLQTMTFGPNMVDADEISIRAPRNSASYQAAVMRRQFPASWLPQGAEQIIRTAEPAFRLVSSDSGRLDYIETIRQWGIRYRRFDLRKYLMYASLVPRFLFDRRFRERISGDQVGANIYCFENNLFNHYRMVFERA